MFTRKIRRYRADRNTYRLLSLKTGRLMYIESYLELLWALLFDRDPDVLWFAMQPVSYFYRKPGDSANTRRRYTPDAIVRYPDGRRAFEIKPAARVDEKLEAKVELLDRKLGRDFGMSLEIRTELDLGSKVQRRNLSLLRRYSRVTCNPDALKAVAARARAGDTIMSLIDRVVRDGGHPSDVWVALSKGFLRVDETQPITNTSVLEVL